MPSLGLCLAESLAKQGVGQLGKEPLLNQSGGGGYKEQKQ